jgi:hypothetical protein
LASITHQTVYIHHPHRFGIAHTQETQSMTMHTVHFEPLNTQSSLDRGMTAGKVQEAEHAVLSAD